MTVIFGWEELITEEISRSLKALVGLPAEDYVEGFSEHLAQVFESLGSLPLFSGELNEETRTQIAYEMLERASQRVLKEAGIERLSSGYWVLQPTDGPLENSAQPTDRIAINIAKEEDLEPLPYIGRALAERIIEERKRGGYYLSIEDLSDRISGLGEQAERGLRSVFSFLPPAQAHVAKRREDFMFPTCVSHVFAMIRETEPEAILLGALDLMATSCSESTPQLTMDFPFVNAPSNRSIEAHHADVVAVLKNTDYYYTLPELFSEAQIAIEIMMFHIAFPSDSHPTRTLLDSLIQAHRRGVQVRVILDRDRETDPYKSTVINTPAKDYLEAAGIQCLFDRENELLHSKVVLIDNDRVILGSHNWSAGSYFQFDDLSIAVTSRDYCHVMKERFNTMWLNLSSEE